MKKTKHQIKNGQFHLTPLECEILLESAADERDYLLIRILIDTGIRREEVATLMTMNFYTRKGSLLVVGKGNKKRMIPIPPGLLQKVRFFINKTNQGKKGYLFPSRQSNCKKAPISVGTVNSIVTKAGKEGKIKNPNPRYKNLNPHLLRHSFAHKWKEKGMSWDKLSMVMGHESAVTTITLYGLPSYEDVEDFMINSHSKHPSKKTRKR